jgi:hypothetical protein
LIKMAHSISCGLSHLHTEIFGTRGKYVFYFCTCAIILYC